MRSIHGSAQSVRIKWCSNMNERGLCASQLLAGIVSCYLQVRRVTRLQAASRCLSQNLWDGHLFDVMALGCWAYLKIQNCFETPDMFRNCDAGSQDVALQSREGYLR